MSANNDRTRSNKDFKGFRGFTRFEIVLGALLLALLLSFCRKADVPGQSASKKVEKSYRIAVFVPGVVEGSPIYEMLVQGSTRAAEEHEHVSADVIEGGFNQAQWQEKIMSLAATGTYDLIVTSNPSMPSICAEVARSFPSQKFAVMDGYLAGHPQIYTVLFNQMEQGYLIGYLAGLVSTSDMAGANADLKVGLIAGQHYPLMDQAIVPGFRQGFQAVDSEIELDFRIVGNWYDANKAAELAGAMFDMGTDVILSIAGGAGQGVVTTARDRGKYVLWFDSNGYGIAPGTVVGSGILKNDRAAYETVKQALAGELPYGKPKKVGVREGYIDFISDDDRYRAAVPEALRQKMAECTNSFKSGALHIEMPEL